MHAGLFFYDLLLSADFFFLKKITFSKNYFRNTTIGSNGLDSYQDCHSVGPDLGSNCLSKVFKDIVNLEILKCDFLLCIMNTPMFVVSNLMEEFISIHKG